MDWTNDLLYQRPELFTSKNSTTIQLSRMSLYSSENIVSKQDILDLGEEDDPDAVCAMIKDLYGDNYFEQVPVDHAEHFDNYLTVYTIGDKYDSATLRQQALNKLLRSIESELS
ncbi:unnamed protein product [Aureobasidium pullulans]|nr:unnamed protein product [Aureobasidium pullulans]